MDSPRQVPSLFGCQILAGWNGERGARAKSPKGLFFFELAGFKGLNGRKEDDHFIELVDQ
jgi:hypothetical protein